jgi:hypothetical protein
MIDHGRGSLYEGERLVALVDYALEMRQGRPARGTLRVVGSSLSHVFTDEIMKDPPVKLTLHLADGDRWGCFLTKTELGSPEATAVARSRA